MIQEILEDLKFQVSEEEALHGAVINPDFKSGDIKAGILISVRQAKMLIDFLEQNSYLYTGKANGL